MISIEDALAKWSTSDDGRKTLLKYKNEITKKADSTDAIFGIGKDAKSLEDIFYSVKTVFMDVIEAAGFDYGEYLEMAEIETKEIGGEIVWDIRVDFRDDAIHRDSWYPVDRDGNKTEWADGADNIVALMNHGYDAKDYVYADVMINGRKHRVRSLRTRQGAHFMETAEKICNDRVDGYWVTVSPEYLDENSGYFQ